MKTSNILNLTIASFISLSGCGGTVSTLEYYDEGTGARSGDGDGDGDVPATGARPGDGDGDTPATGARPGDGDGDGDGDTPATGARPGNGDGGSPVSSGGRTSGGRNGDGGVPIAAGGSMGGRPIGSGGAFGGSGGGSMGGRPVGSGGALGGSGGGSIATGGSGPIGGGTGSGGTINGCEDVQIYDGGAHCNGYGRCEDGEIWSYCYGSSCQCEGSRGWAEFQLNGPVGAARCGELLSYCASDAFNTPTDDEVCEQTYYEQARDYCSAQTQCIQEVGLSSGIAQLTSWRQTYCSRDGTKWQCGCSGSHTELRFELDTDVADSKICQELSDSVCDGSAIEVTGPPICEPEYQSASNDSCDIQYSCAAPATINGYEGRLFEEYRSANCKRTADGFYCSCDYADGFTMQAEDAWEACSGLAERCGGG